MPGGFTLSDGEPLIAAPLRREVRRRGAGTGLSHAVQANGYYGEKLSNA
jgi:pyruvate-formate lyase-activating enzyme